MPCEKCSGMDNGDGCNNDVNVLCAIELYTLRTGENGKVYIMSVLYNSKNTGKKRERDSQTLRSAGSHHFGTQ